MPSTRSEPPGPSRSSPPMPSTRTTRCRPAAFGNRSSTPLSASTAIPDGPCASRAKPGVGTDRPRRCSGSTTTRFVGLLGLAADELAHMREAGVIGERPLGL